MISYFVFSNKKRQFKMSGSNNEEMIERNNKVGKVRKKWQSNLAKV